MHTENSLVDDASDQAAAEIHFKLLKLKLEDQAHNFSTTISAKKKLWIVQDKIYTLSSAIYKEQNESYTNGMAAWTQKKLDLANEEIRHKGALDAMYFLHPFHVLTTIAPRN